MTSTVSGATPTASGTDFSVWSDHADKIELCLFDRDGKTETDRLEMIRDDDGNHHLHVDKVGKGQRYGFRAYGRYEPENGFWFDPAKLLIDPYAKELDRAFTYDGRLAVFGEDTADLVPRTIVGKDRPVKQSAPKFKSGGFIYELSVKAFTQLHPQVPVKQRGTIAALAHPAVIAHLQKIGVDAVELLPITAWIDERHLPALGLTNAWGYNPVAMMALDPRLAPGGVKELRDTVSALHNAGIGVILDLVFNHTGESDVLGPTLSLRGLSNISSYRHQADNAGVLINDTGTGNTLACDHPYIRRLIVDSLRHFVLNAGIDGFRFDLGPVLGRTAHGFDRHAETLRAITSDEVLCDRILIAEPWDIGPGGYQLGNFPEPFLEWNDQARDTIRKFWRCDHHMTGAMATALAGSSDIFSRHEGTQTRSVNFIAAHDGFTLMDIVSFAHKHNERNGEDNRDGHNENLSWNNGAEGPSEDAEIASRRKRDIMALLSTLFASRGAIMLTAGDEGGRTQQGNNNAYCQDNEITWLDWETMDAELIDLTASLQTMRRRFSVFSDTRLLTDHDVEWLTLDGQPMSVSDWEQPDAAGFAMVLKTHDAMSDKDTRLAVIFNRSDVMHRVELPMSGTAEWQIASTGATPTTLEMDPRSVVFLVQH
ncbi:glycogen debranching protein GlgX [Agrobacterium sp. ES01]|uniref:glycogen debranching protein GlgX n=1 Tax=Agrobacterium sp. ES01 TaxID=3420714 RepID=UPI003D0A72E6